MAPISQEFPVREKADVDASQGGPVKFGKEVKEQHFLFDPAWRNLNHGSFGTIPRAIQAKQRWYQDQAEARPDPFIRYDYPKLLDVSRAAIARHLRVPTDTVVFVPNATTAVNVVLRNLVWSPDGRDEILYFDTIYGGCARTIDYVVEDRRGLVTSRCIPLSYPCEDDAVVAAFHAAVAASRAAGNRPRICLFDVVSSLPGVRFPFEAITTACREAGILSLVDGAQGVGMVDIDLGAVDPDFFLSNCHKWLHVPRGCAVFQVPFRNQPLIRSPLPTSHGFIPRPADDGEVTQPRFNPLPPSNKSEFVYNFEFVGTVDGAPYLCVADSLRWREEVLGGEARILEGLTALAREGGQRAAEVMGTQVLDNASKSLTRCPMVNVALPLVLQTEGGAVSDAAGSAAVTIPKADTMAALNWILETLMSEYKTFVALFVYNGCFWARLSAQVYLEVDDFVWAGETLKALCERVGKGEYKVKKED